MVLVLTSLQNQVYLGELNYLQTRQVRTLYTKKLLYLYGANVATRCANLLYRSIEDRVALKSRMLL